jgi:DNA anti-recombination protein RmuC
VDPITLFLLKMIRDSVLSSAVQAGVEGALNQSKPDPTAQLPRLAPLPPDEGQWLRSLIDESFVHLSAQQRDELYASLMRMLNDPRYSEMRAAMLAEFTQQAIALRDARRRLAGLTEGQMKTIAVEARREFERLPADQRKQMLAVLQQGVPGMPRTLNDLILAEFSSAGGRAQ